MVLVWSDLVTPIYPEAPHVAVMQAHMTLQSRSFKTVGRPSRQLRTQALFGSRNASTVPIDKPAGRGKKAQQQEPVDKVKEYK